MTRCRIPLFVGYSDEEEEHYFVKFLDDTNFEELYCHPLDPFEVIAIRNDLSIHVH